MPEIVIPSSDRDYECPWCGWGGCDGYCDYDYQYDDWPELEEDKSNDGREKAEQ